MPAEAPAPDLLSSTDETMLIDLGAALRLAEFANPQIRVARAQLSEAIAVHRGARAMLLPDINIGTNYDLHNGPIQTSFGQIREVNRQSLYVGGGARSLAAETVAIPAVRVFSHLGEALYTPLAARQEVAARSADLSANRNDILLDVVTRYLELAAAEARIEAWHASQKEIAQLERDTAAFAQTGQGREGDYQRARSETLLMQVEKLRSEAEAIVASNELARLLRLDPAIRLTTPQAPMELIDLISADASLDDLVATALTRRPEVAARSAAIGAAQYRMRLEQTRILFPLVSVGYSAGGFGGGSNRTDLGVDSMFQRFAGRSDFDVYAVWTLQNLGFGNMALSSQRRADRDTAINDRGVTLALIRRQVTQSYAQIEAARDRISIVEQQQRAALLGADQELRRTRAGEGLPIEALNSIKLLAESRQDVVNVVMNYDLAQFRMFVALGSRPSDQSPDPTRTTANKNSELVPAPAEVAPPPAQ